MLLLFAAGPREERKGGRVDLRELEKQERNAEDAHRLLFALLLQILQQRTQGSRSMSCLETLGGSIQDLIWFLGDAPRPAGTLACA